MEPNLRIELRDSLYKSDALPLSESGGEADCVFSQSQVFQPYRWSTSGHQSLCRESNPSHIRTKDTYYRYTTEAFLLYLRVLPKPAFRPPYVGVIE